MVGVEKKVLRMIDTGKEGLTKFESNYQIESKSADEIMEFKTFKAAYKRLIWLRKVEGEKKWPYLITNIKTGEVHDFFCELERENEEHKMNLEYRWSNVRNRLDLVDDHKVGSKLWKNLWEFALEMWWASR